MEITIKIDELVYRVAAATRKSMDEKFAEDVIGYGWLIDEEDFLNDVKKYVGSLFDDGDILDKKMVERLIYDGLLNVENFMLKFYEVKTTQDDGEDFVGTLGEYVSKFNVQIFRKEWILEDLVSDWDSKYIDYIFEEAECEFSYQDILDVYFQ